MNIATTLARKPSWENDVYTVHVKPWSASCNESWLPVDPRKVRSLLIEMTRTHPFVFSLNKIKKEPTAAS